MDVALAVALVLAVLFAFTNGIHDASNAIAALVATRAARPLQAALMAAVFNLLGPLVVGSAVADTIGGIVTVGGDTGVEVIAAGLLAAMHLERRDLGSRASVELRPRARRRPRRGGARRRRHRRDQVGRDRRVGIRSG